MFESENHTVRLVQKDFSLERFWVATSTKSWRLLKSKNKKEFDYYVYAIANLLESTMRATKNYPFPQKLIPED